MGVRPARGHVSGSVSDPSMSQTGFIVVYENIKMPDRSPPYPPLRDYAAIGDGRTVALVALDGSIDWLCLPDLDSPSVFASLLDAEQGGRFVLCPEGRHDATRRYRPGTNVLETTFVTAAGTVRVTDALTLPARGLEPLRELARRVEGLAGRVVMRWRLEPRFGYGSARTRIEPRSPFPVAVSGSDALAACAWEVGQIRSDSRAIGGTFEIRAGARAMIALVTAHGEPLVFPGRGQVEARLDFTCEFWRRWSDGLVYTGPWGPAGVVRGLARKS